MPKCSTARPKSFILFFHYCFTAVFIFFFFRFRLCTLSYYFSPFFQAFTIFSFHYIFTEFYLIICPGFEVSPHFKSSLPLIFQGIVLLADYKCLSKLFATIYITVKCVTKSIRLFHMYCADSKLQMCGELAMQTGAYRPSKQAENQPTFQ